MRALPMEKLPLSGMTGKNIKVAVVDSGINPMHPHVQRIAGGVKVSLDESDRIVFDDEDIFDDVGHGTACASIIRKKAPEAVLYSVKIFDETLSTHVVVLIEAIQWCIDKEMDIINLSLGTQNKECLSHLREVCSAAFLKGIIIVAASKIGDESYPASFQEVIGVTSHPECPENVILYSEASQIKFLTSGYPRYLPGFPPEHNFRGESFAAAHLSGIVALLREKYPFFGTEDIKNILLESD